MVCLVQIFQHDPLLTISPTYSLWWFFYYYQRWPEFDSMILLHYLKESSHFKLPEKHRNQTLQTKVMTIQKLPAHALHLTVN